MLKTLAIENYRSLQNVVLALGRLNIVTGPNGSGKSNIYRALSLVRDIIRDGALSSLAHEGGLRNAVHAGERSQVRVAMRLGIAFDQLNYAIDLGLPQLGPFPLDPEVKSELVWHGLAPRPSAVLASRTGQHVTLLDEAGKKTAMSWRPRTEESMLATLTDPSQAPELYTLREMARGWKFYDNLRVDALAPARLPSPATFTPTLSHDGSNLASALATVLRVGNEGAFSAAISQAFDGATVHVEEDTRGIAHVTFDSHLRRKLDVTELSDGTLRFLMLATILHSPRPAPLLVLNEPEASLHGSLIPALAQMIHHASRESQIIVVTHSTELVRALGDLDSPMDSGDSDSVGSAPCTLIELSGSNPTQIVGQFQFDGPEWIWPASRK